MLAALSLKLSLEENFVKECSERTKKRIFQILLLTLNHISLSGMLFVITYWEVTKRQTQYQKLCGESIALKIHAITIKK